MPDMTTLVLTVIGDDRAGLVNALAEVVAAHGGNWEQSHLAELAGKFAGIVLVTVPDAHAEALTQALRPLAGMLDITAQRADSDDTPAEPTLTIELLGNDHPGMVREVTAVLTRHAVTIVEMLSATRQAPMAGGQLFEARVTAAVPDDADLGAVREDLELLAGELLVDLRLSTD